MVATSIPGGDIILLTDSEGTGVTETLEPLRPELEAAGTLYLLLSGCLAGLDELPGSAAELREMERALIELDARTQPLRMEASAVLRMLLHAAGDTRAREVAAALLAPHLARCQATQDLATA